MVLDIQVLPKDRHKNVAGLNGQWDSIPPLLITGSPTVKGKTISLRYVCNTYTFKRQATSIDSLPPEKTTYCHKTE